MASSSKHLPPDFRVSYRLLRAEKGGRKSLPFQYIRWDFAYEDESVATANKLFMIWPEFITPSGETLPEGTLVPKQDLADMFILNTAFREFHSRYIKLGVRGYFREGGRKVGLCEVVEILALHQNPKT